MSRFKVSLLAVCLAVFLVFSVLVRADDTKRSGQSNNSAVNNQPGTRQEIIAARTLYSKTYRNDDGTDTMVVTAAPQHFRDENGKLVDIDSSLDSDCREADSDGETYGFQSRMNSFEMMLPRHSKGWTKLRAKSGKSWLEFKLITGEKRNFNKNGSHRDQIMANDILPNCDLSYTVKKGALKEEFILKTPMAQQPVFEFKIKAHNLSMTKLESEDGGYQFFDRDGNLVFHLPKFVMWDRQKISDDIDVEVEKRGNTYDFKIIPSKTWLNSSERVYPVIIDPTCIIVQGDPNVNNKGDRYHLFLYVPCVQPLNGSTSHYNLSGAGGEINVNRPLDVKNPSYNIDVTKPYATRVDYIAKVGNPEGTWGNTYGNHPGGSWTSYEPPVFKITEWDPNQQTAATATSARGNTLVKETYNYTDWTEYPQIRTGSCYIPANTTPGKGAALVEMDSGHWQWGFPYMAWGLDIEYQITFQNETMSPEKPQIVPLPPETHGTTVKFEWAPPTDGVNTVIDPVTGEAVPQVPGVTSQGIDRYFVQMSTDPNFTNPPPPIDVGNVLYKNFTGLAVGLTYYFRVYAQDKDLNPTDKNHTWSSSYPSGIRWSDVSRTKCIDNISTPSAFTDRTVCGDFDGDGKKDDIAALYDCGNNTAKIYVWLSNGSSFQYAGEWWTGNSFNVNMITGRVVSGDFNGDHKDDIAAVYDYNDLKPKIWVWQSGGSSFSSSCWWTASSFDPTKITGRVIAGDFNKDNKDEIAALYDYGSNQSKIWVWQASGNSFSESSWWSGSSFDVTKTTGRVVCGDFDGNGFKDIATFYDYGDLKPKAWLFQSNGSSFSAYNWWTASSFDPTKITKRVIAGDFDGNAKDDIAAFYDYGNNVAKIWTWMSSGGAFSAADWWNSSSYNVNLLTGRVVCGDFDGDSKRDDIAGLYDKGNNQTTIHVWLSNNNPPYQYCSDNGRWGSLVSLPQITNVTPGNLVDRVYYGSDRNPTFTWSYSVPQQQVQLGVAEYYSQPKTPTEYPVANVFSTGNSAKSNWNLPDGQYIAYVKCDWPDWSGGQLFTIDTAPPALPKIVDELVPENHSRVRFTFPEGINEPVAYELYWSDDPNNFGPPKQQGDPNQFVAYDKYKPIVTPDGAFEDIDTRVYYYYFVFRDRALNSITTPVYSIGSHNIANSTSANWGLESYWNYKSISLGRAGNAQVNLNNGNVIVSAMDFSLPGLGIPLTMTRYYDSMANYEGMLGKGWRTSFEIFLQIYGPNGANGQTIIINDPDGSSHSFIYYNSTYNRPPGDYRKVFVNGTGYKVTDKTGMKYYFGAPDAGGISKLTSIEDRFGNLMTLTYTNGFLSSVQEPSGYRKVIFIPETIGGKQYLSRIEFTPTEPGYGTRYITYSRLSTYNGVRLSDVYYLADDGSTIDVNYNYDSFWGYLSSSKVSQPNAVKNNTSFYYKSCTYSIGSVVTGFNDDPTNPGAYVTVKHYFDYNGATTTYIDPRGQEYVYTHTATGQCQSVLMPSCVNPVSYTYDGDFNLKTLTRKKAVYDPRTGVESPNKKVVTEYFYNPQNGNVTSIVVDQLQQDPNDPNRQYKQIKTSFDYYSDYSNQNGVETDLKTITDPRSKITNFENVYTNGKLERMTINPPDDHTILQKFDTKGQRSDKDVKLKSSPSQTKYHFGYDYLNGLLYKLTNAFGTATYDYTVYGERKSVLDANGIKQDSAINPYTGHLWSVPFPVLTGGSGFQPLSYTGSRYIYNYDISGNKTAEYDAKNHNTIYFYDELNQLYRVQSPSMAGVLQYNSYNNYDANGNLLKTIDYNSKATNYVYDSLNRRTQVIDSAGKTQEKLVYDELGRIKTRYDGELVNHTDYFYDSVDNLLRTNHFQGSTLKYTTYYYKIDQANNLIAYDNNGNLLYKKAPVSAIESYKNGQPVEYLETNYIYDDVNRPSSVVQTCGSNNKYNQTIDYAYEAGQLRTMKVTVYGGNPQIYTYDYDGAQRLDTLTRDYMHPSNQVIKGERVKFSYYPGGQRQQKLIYKLSTDTTPLIKVDYKYDTAYRLLNLDYSWGSSYNYNVKMGYKYNEIDKITDNPITYNVSAPVVVNYLLSQLPPNKDDYKRPSVPSLRTGSASHPAGSPNPQYVYDDLGRLTESSVYEINPGLYYGTSPSVYSKYQKTVFSSIDANGNPGSKVITANNVYSTDTTTETSYYDIYGLNHFSSKIVDAPGVENDYTINSYSYDENGNDIREQYNDGRPNSTFDYGLDSQLLKSYSETKNKPVDKWGSTTNEKVDCYTRTTKTFSYELNGRILKTNTDAKDCTNQFYPLTQKMDEYFYTSHDGVVADRQIDFTVTPTTESIKHFTRVGRELICCDENNSTYFYIQNLRGDVIMLVNSDGSVASIRDYDVNGQMLSKAPGITIDKDPFGFTGGMDAGNGLWKLGARFYDSSKNSFIQQDRYLGDPSDPLSLNRYVYCGLDPVNFVDPTGFMAEALQWGLKIAGGTGTTIALLTGVGEAAIGVALISAGTYMLADAIKDSIVEAKGTNQVNDSIKKGKAPKDATRADKGKIKGEQDHIHWKDGSALNKDGTWKHGSRDLTSAEKEWLGDNGWRIPGEN